MFIETVRWDHPGTTLVAGPSNSGKTTLISKILQHKNDLFTRPNLKTILFYNQNQDIYKKSQHGCVRWALREHLTPPCCDFACGGLEDCHQNNNITLIDNIPYSLSLLHIQYLPLSIIPYLV